MGLEGEELSEAEIKSALRQRTLANEIVPITCGSAFKNKGVQAVLDGVVEYMPAPTQVKQIQGILENGTEEERPADDKAPFAALAFKIATDPFVGTLTFSVFTLVLLNRVTRFITQLKVSVSDLVVSYRCIQTHVKRSKKFTQAILRQLLVLK